MDFESEFCAFLSAEGVGPGLFVPVPLVARDPIRATALSERLSPLAGSVSFVVEDRWRKGGEALRERILAHAGRFRSVYARCCEVRRIDKPSAAAFLSAAHSYGDAACRYRYGVFFSEEMVAVGEFSQARRWLKPDGPVRSYEWVRYSSLPGVRVVGGMGKVLEAFANEVRPDDVMSYADLEWSDGGAYRALGFALEGRRDPVMFAVDPDTWERRPLRPGEEPREGSLYYRNFGSLKYRKKYSWNEEKN